MFPQQIESKFLDIPDFLNHALFCAICITAIRCIPLIKKTTQKYHLIVQSKTRISPAVIHHGKLAHTEIAAYKVVFRLHIQIIQERIIYSPWMHIPDRRSICFIIGNAGMHNMTIACNCNKCLIKITGKRYMHAGMIIVRGDLDVTDRVFRHIFQPHGPPDSSSRSIPHATMFHLLFPIGKSTAVRIIYNPQHQ